MYDAAGANREAGVPVVVVAGRDHGGGSSRDWAANGPALLGVRAVIAQSFERIHRSNLVAMGIMPLELVDAGPDDVATTVRGDQHHRPRRARNRPGAPECHRPQQRQAVHCHGPARHPLEVVRHGGVVPYVLRGLLDRDDESLA